MPVAAQGREAPEQGWIPIDASRSGTIFLRGTIFRPGAEHGLDTEMLLDSAAGMTVLDARLARRLGLESAPIAGPEADPDPPGTRRLGPLELGIGTAHFSLPRALELDLSGARETLGREVPVLLGHELFERFVVDLDYPNRRLALRDPKTFLLAGGERTLALLPGAADEILVEAQLDDLPATRFRLDTTARGLELFADFGDELTPHTLTFAGQRFRNVPATSIELESGAPASADCAGSIGAEILSRFRVVFDVPHARLILEPAPDCGTRPFPRN